MPAHVVQRAKERLGFNLSKKDLAELSKMIEDDHPNVKLLQRKFEFGPNKVICRYRVNWRNKNFIVVVGEGGTLITLYKDNNYTKRRQRIYNCAKGVKIKGGYV